MIFLGFLEARTEVIFPLYCAVWKTANADLFGVSIYTGYDVLCSGAQFSVDCGFRGLQAARSFLGCGLRISRWVVVACLNSRLAHYVC